MLLLLMHDANAELKITDVCSIVKPHDVTVLTETRTSDASRLLLQLPGFTVHNIKLDKGNEGKNGHGIAVDRKSTRLNSSHRDQSRMPSSA